MIFFSSQTPHLTLEHPQVSLLSEDLPEDLPEEHRTVSHVNDHDFSPESTLDTNGSENDSLFVDTNADDDDSDFDEDDESDDDEDMYDTIGLRLRTNIVCVCVCVCEKK